MSTQYIQLKNPSGDLLYPRTDWRAILDKPSIASAEALALKQDKLTSANSGPGINIETIEGGVLRISAINSTNYSTLTNKPRINGITLVDNLTLSALGINYNESTSDGAWEVADEAGNVVLRITNQGHLVTKEFDSENLPTALSQFTNDMNFLSQATLDSALATFKTSTLDPIYVTHTGFSTDLASALGTAASPNYDLGIFSNAAGYLKPETLQQYFVAGANIQISRSGNVMTISAASGGGSGGTTNYNDLTNRPSLNGITLVSGQTYATFGLPHIATTSLGAFDVVDDSNNAVFRITNEGHIRSKEFDSSNIQGVDIKSGETGSYVTNGYVLTANGSGLASWQPQASGGMSNPMTTVGDIIYGGTNGAPTRLAGGTDNMGKVLTIWADGEPHWADTQHRFTGNTSGIGVVLSVGTNQLSSSAASANDYVLYWSGGPVWGRVTPASINTGSSVTGNVIVSGGSGGSAAWGKVPGTSVSSLSITSGYVLTADGSGGASWQSTGLVHTAANCILKSVANGAPVWSSQAFIAERAGTAQQQGQYLFHIGSNEDENTASGGPGIIRLARYHTRILLYPTVTTDSSVTTYKNAYYSLNPDVGSTNSAPAKILSSITTNTADQLALFTGTTTLKGIALANYFTLTTSNDTTTLAIDTTTLGLQGTAVKSGTSGSYATSGYVLTADGSGSASWQPQSGGGGGGMANPMTTKGDIIYASDNNGTPARLARGSMGSLLVMDGSLGGSDDIPKWVAHPLVPGKILQSGIGSNGATVYWDDIQGTQIRSGTTGSYATSGDVLTADGSGGASWATPASATIQTNASLSYEDNSIVLVSNAITAFTMYVLPLDCTQVVITVKHSVYDSSTEGYSWEINTITLDSSTSTWTDFPDDPDDYYCTFTFVPGLLTFTNYGEGGTRWNLDNDDDPEIYTYACPEYTAYKVETQLGVASPPILSSFTINSPIGDAAVLSALNVGSPIYIVGAPLIALGVSFISPSQRFLFFPSHDTTGQNYSCFILGRVWVTLNYLDNAFISYEIKYPMPLMYLHTLIFSGTYNNVTTSYTLRYLGSTNSSITSFSSLQTLQNNTIVRLIYGMAQTSSTIYEVMQCSYAAVNTEVAITARLFSGNTTFSYQESTFSSISDSIQAWAIT